VLLSVLPRPSKDLLFPGSLGSCHFRIFIAPGTR
jgi:hypothetical protein